MDLLDRKTQRHPVSTSWKQSTANPHRLSTDLVSRRVNVHALTDTSGQLSASVNCVGRVVEGRLTVNGDVTTVTPQSGVVPFRPISIGEDDVSRVS